MNSSDKVYDVVVIGGGLAGLCSAIHIAKCNFSVLLVEKNSYPKHKVCGEYVSNEVLPYLKYLGFNPFEVGAQRISKFHLTTQDNKSIHSDLPLGGFGISRYKFDYELYQLALKAGVKVFQDTVVQLQFTSDKFRINTNSGNEFQSRITIGAFGKRSNLDIVMKRSFIERKSPYLGVKMHVSGHFPPDKVALHNFRGGYCGVSKIENDHINLCYITSFKAFKKHKDIGAFQKEVVFKNHNLKKIFTETEPVFDKPLTISQISFETKKPIENHIMMCGDSAGMIHPLCGNGMGMAIRSAQLSAELIIDYLEGKIPSRQKLEYLYTRRWKQNFSSRLRVGHTIAYLFRQEWLSPILLGLLSWFPFLTPSIIKLTHGKTMKV